MTNTIQQYKPRLQSKYHEVTLDYLKDKLKVENTMEIPKIDKVVINVGLGNAKENSTNLKNALEELTIIAGQKAVVTYAKKAISNFKIREKDPLGVRVTLRRQRMYEFLDRFISIACPRIRDFSGFRVKGFDGMGNYNFGITEQIIFPEIFIDQVNKITGMDITIVTTASTDKEAFELLKEFGLPFKK